MSLGEQTFISCLPSLEVFRVNVHAGFLPALGLLILNSLLVLGEFAIDGLLVSSISFGSEGLDVSLTPCSLCIFSKLAGIRRSLILSQSFVLCLVNALVCSGKVSVLFAQLLIAHPVLHHGDSHSLCSINLVLDNLLLSSNVCLGQLFLDNLLSQRIKSLEACNLCLGSRKARLTLPVGIGVSSGSVVLNILHSLDSFLIIFVVTSQISDGLVGFSQSFLVSSHAGSHGSSFILDDLQLLVNSEQLLQVVIVQRLGVINGCDVTSHLCARQVDVIQLLLQVLLIDCTISSIVKTCLDISLTRIQASALIDNGCLEVSQSLCVKISLVGSLCIGQSSIIHSTVVLHIVCTSSI